VDKIKIITDSTADLPPDIVERYDIEVLPLLVNINGNTYKDGVDINLLELLDKMENSYEFPSTSQVNPQRFFECYERYVKEGYKILSIHLSSKMSGVFQSACIAKDMLETEDIMIIDTQNVTSGLGLLVLKACDLKEEGKNINEIYDEVLKTMPHVKSVLVFGSLENLVQGGRLSKTAGVVGNILGIKLIMCIEDGEVKLKDKVRGSKRAVKYVIDYIDKMGIKEGETSVLLHVENTDILPVLRDNLVKKGSKFFECEVGCVVGVHAGRGACGIFFIEKY
jgi:DegV family protein with EDD domain